MKTASTLKWLFSLTGVFFKNAPSATIVVVLLTLCSQIAMTLATLLPLKVVMLLGSERIPRFFPQAFMEIDRNNLVLSLVALSVTSYFAVIFFNWVNQKTTDHGANELIKKTQKIILFENQDSFAASAYTKYTVALAGLIFFLAITAGFALFYPEVAFLVIAYLLVSQFLTYLLYRTLPTFASDLHRTPIAVTGRISNIGFLLVFLFIVIDFLYFTPPNFIVALLTIILARLMLNRLSFTAAYLLSLKKNEAKINALFFHNQVFLPDAYRQNASVWDLLRTTSINTWLPALMQEATKQENNGNLNFQWQQTKLKDILVLKVQTDNKSFLVKVFEQRLSTKAQHESTLMIEADTSTFPSPKLLLTSKVSNYHCHIFDITGLEFLSFREGLEARRDIDNLLLVICPSTELIERYRRSKAFLWERINQNMLDRLRLIFKEDVDCIEAFEEALPQIKSILESLPLNFVNHKLNNSSILCGLSYHPVSFHWAEWSIEPVGSGLRDKEETFREMDELIDSAAERRHELSHFPINYYKIAALVSAFEQRYEKQQYRDAIELVTSILEHLD